MNESRIQQLFEAARAETALEPPAGFAARVAGALRREALPSTPAPVLEALGSLFPRLAWVAVLVIGLCAAAGFYSATRGAKDLSADVAAVAEQWLFAAD